MINYVEDVGGVEALATRWRPQTKAIFIAEVEGLIRVLEDWTLRLAETEPVPELADELPEQTFVEVP